MKKDALENLIREINDDLTRLEIIVKKSIERHPSDEKHREVMKNGKS